MNVSLCNSVLFSLTGTPVVYLDVVEIGLDPPAVSKLQVLHRGRLLLDWNARGVPRCSSPVNARAEFRPWIAYLWRPTVHSKAFVMRASRGG